MERDALHELLAAYYRNEFPASIWCRWVAAGCRPHPLSHRELSFTLAHDIYVRYLSVRGLPEFKTLLQKKCPHKIDIGAVYDSEPSVAKHSSTVQSRELVFDIDMTDYDDVRTCCKGADVCVKCWKYIIIACRILDRALVEDFGFANVLWVFSGRRGVHCWVSSAEARSLSAQARGAVADYLSLISGGEARAKKVQFNTDTLHHSVKRACTVVDELFDTVLEEQQFLSTNERLDNFYKMIPDDLLANKARERLSSMPSDSNTRWKAFLELYKSYYAQHNSDRRIRHLVEEIKLQWCYPRLDVNVTKGLNHLLKAPFSVHPKTERVCTVFRSTEVQDFDPAAAPMLSDLLDEQSPKHSDAKKRMRDAVAIFQAHVFALEKEEAKKKRTAAESKLDF